MTNIIPFISEEEIKNFADLTDEVIFAFQPSLNKLLFVNPAFEKVWHIRREHIDTNLSVITGTIHPDDLEYMADCLATIKREKKTQMVEFRIIAPGNTIKWIKICAYYIQRSTADTIVGSAADISTDKAYSDNLHKFSDRKNSILSILSHDLAGPLGNILMTSRLLAARPNKFSTEMQEKLLNIIIENSKRGGEMIHDFLNQEFLETSEVRLKLTRINLSAKIREIIDQYRITDNLSDKRFQLYSPVPNLYANVDESKFMQVINNLLSNAIKFTRNDGTIEIEMHEEADGFFLAIKDNGIGIPQDLHPFLFDKFTKAGRKGLYGEPTTGLGMSIVKTIIEWHKGRIWFESAENVGTTFYIFLPK